MLKIFGIVLMSICLCSQVLASTEEEEKKTVGAKGVQVFVYTEPMPPLSLQVPSLSRGSSGVESPSVSSPCGEFQATAGHCNPYPKKDDVVSHSTNRFFVPPYSGKTYGCGGTELAVGMSPTDSANNSLASSMESLVVAPTASLTAAAVQENQTRAQGQNQGFQVQEVSPDTAVKPKEKQDVTEVDK